VLLASIIERDEEGRGSLRGSRVDSDLLELRQPALDHLTKTGLVIVDRSHRRFKPIPARPALWCDVREKVDVAAVPVISS
jgi:hypothetical protein